MWGFHTDRETTWRGHLARVQQLYHPPRAGSRRVVGGPYLTVCEPAGGHNPSYESLGCLSGLQSPVELRPRPETRAHPAERS
jgi:hypothetical protein